MNTTDPQSQTKSVASLENKRVVGTWHPLMASPQSGGPAAPRSVRSRFAYGPQPTWEKLEVSKASIQRALKRRLKSGEPCTRAPAGHGEKLHFSEGSGWGRRKGQLGEGELGAEPGYGILLPGTVLRAGCAHPAFPHWSHRSSPRSAGGPGSHRYQPQGSTTCSPKLELYFLKMQNQP